MAEINNSIAAQVNANPINLGSTLGTISQFQQAQALVGLKDIQTLQAQRQYNALQAAATAYKGKQDPVGAYLSAGGDPSGAGQLQNVFAGQKAMGITPGGLLPEAYSHLSSAGKSQAETRKIGQETLSVGTDFGAKLAQGVIADPSNDSVWANAVNQHYQTVGGPSLERQQLLGVKDPAQRLQIAKAYAAQGVSPNTYGTPHNVSPTDAVTTPGASYAVPRSLPPNQQGGMIGAPGERIIGGSVVQDNGVPIPNQQVANRFGVMPPAMTPGQVAQSKGYGEEGVTQYKDALAKYQNAGNVQYGLTDIEKNLDKLPTGGFWTTGTGAGTRVAMAKGINTAMQTFGLPTVFDPEKVAAGEAANKGTTRLGFDLAKTLGSREAAMIVQQSIGVQPGMEMTPQGNRAILLSLNAAAQRDKDYFNFLSRYQKANPNSLPGEAAAEFNDQHPPQAYVQDVKKMQTIPTSAINYLRTHPNNAEQFNQYYGGDFSRYFTGSK